MKYDELKDFNLVKHLIRDIDNNAGWLCFFLIFSRFEYALKRSNYITGDESRTEADWNKFGEDVKQAFKKQECTELREATKYLLSKNTAPKKQFMNSENKLDWRLPNGIDEDIQSLINTVKIVRNNLFHGGKYPSGPVKDPSRDEQLIKHSITVLKYLLCSSVKVKSAYFKSLEE